MSFQATNLVCHLKKSTIEELNNKNFTSGVKCLLLIMANYCDQNFQFYPSRRTLADEVGCSLKSIDNYNNYLMEIGLIKKVNRKCHNKGNNSNLYELTIGQFLTKHGYQLTMNDKGFISATKKNSESPPTKPNVNNNATHEKSNDLDRVTVTHDPITDPITEPKDKRSTSFSNEEAEIEFDRLWKVWPNSSDKKRSLIKFKGMIKGMTPDSIRKRVNSLIRDIEKRLNTTQKGIESLMLSTYIANERWNDGFHPLKESTEYKPPSDKTNFIMMN